MVPVQARGLLGSSNRSPRWSNGAACLLLWAGALAGCAHVPRECLTPPPMYVTLQASTNLNLDANGQSLSTLVRILQLTSLTQLETARFLDVWQRPQEVLGEDLLKASEDIPLDPNDTVSRWIPREAKTQFVVAVAAFRQPGEMWYGAFKLGAVPENQCAPRPITDQELKLRPGDEHLRFKLAGFVIEPVEDSGSKK